MERPSRNNRNLELLSTEHTDDTETISFGVFRVFRGRTGFDDPKPENALTQLGVK
jgi:hypothetical protein